MQKTLFKFVTIICCSIGQRNRYIEVYDINIQNHESNVWRSMHVQCQFNKKIYLARRLEDVYKFIMKEFDRVFMA